MAGVNSILDIGRWALFASQGSIQTVGNNIANVNTPGYSRQEVHLEEGMGLDFSYGQIGTGVRATEVIRHFNEFVEEQYNTKSSMHGRWRNLHENLRSVDSLVNESVSSGINDSLATFWADWQNLAARPEDYSSREALLGDTQNLLSAIHTADTDLANFQAQMNDFISQDVARANDLLDEIADVNEQIQAHHVEGKNNANALFDRRAGLVRDLAEIIDVDTIDNGSGDFLVLTKAGHTLVDGTETFRLAFEGPQSKMEILPTSTFEGDVYFDGNDDYEYTVEFVTGGQVSNVSSAAQFRVSLDGGKTWLKDDDGNELHYYARPDERKVQVGELSIWFGSESSSTADPSGQFAVGDKFVISPKQGLYWYRTTSSSVNVTPQISATGQDDSRRIVGGSLAAYFNYRDYYLGRYRDKLDAFSETMAWEVNRLHSQGTGLQRYTYLLGNYSVEHTDTTLASNSTGLHFGSKLQSGNLAVYCYDRTTGDLASNASFGPLDFNTAAAGTQPFDPDTHTLEDVVDAFNDTFGAFLTAEVNNNQLQITSKDGYEIAFGTDTTGLLAALGINTYFKGTDATSLEVNETVVNDLDYICAGHVNGAAHTEEGDNTTALEIAALQYTDVSIKTDLEGTTSRTLQDYFNTFVATVGSDTNNANFNKQYHKALADDLNHRQEETAGVNLDEEMSNLVRFQHSYTAAAKLITAADEMLQTVMAMKR
jgi:flagellar hook-associated protein 1 FlgK